jgi:hypothetical protein
MADIFIYVYILNLTLLILHEVDSAYWQEWNLFNLGGGIDLFLALHFPLIAIALYGLLILPQKTIPALGISMILGLAGICALIIHSYFIKKGRPEFNTATSLIILVATAIASLAQIVLTVTEFGSLNF